MNVRLRSRGVDVKVGGLLTMFIQILSSSSQNQTPFIPIDFLQGIPSTTTPTAMQRTILVHFPGTAATTAFNRNVGDAKWGKINIAF